ncbi:hypothetical protein T4A_6312, partial [Trichinella pseudospiralis]
MRLSAEKRFLQTSWYATTLQWCTEISGEPAVMKQAVVCRQWKCMLIKVASLKIYSAQDNVLPLFSRFLVDVLFVQSEWLAE